MDYQGFQVRVEGYSKRLNFSDLADAIAEGRELAGFGGDVTIWAGKGWCWLYMGAHDGILFQPCAVALRDC